MDVFLRVDEGDLTEGITGRRRMRDRRIEFSRLVWVVLFRDMHFFFFYFFVVSHIPPLS